MDAKAAAESFIRFIREYGPIPRQANMYHEEIEDQARRLGVLPLEFEHPALAEIAKHFAPNHGKLTNLILTGTAGDGKSRLLYQFWRDLGGGEEALANQPKKATHTAVIDEKRVEFRFVFDLSKCLPEGKQEWDNDHIALLSGLVASFLGESKVIFVMAANDGKLLQALRALIKIQPDSRVVEVEPEIEDMLACKRAVSKRLELALMDLSAISSAMSFDRARQALLDRPEVAYFSEVAADPAFGANSLIRRNLEILRQPLFHLRLHTLIELCDVNGFHIPIRDILALLVNGILGHPNAADRVVTLDEARMFANSGESLKGTIHRNIFGENLPEEQRENFIVFNYLNYFRVGHETSNSIDDLLLFGHQLPVLRDTYSRLIIDPTGNDSISPRFEWLRREYLEAEEFDEARREEFMRELANQRRRLFFRLPDDQTASFDSWSLTIFQFAGRFLDTVLHPLKRGEAAAQATVECLVRGLNRVWSGMLFDEGSKLFLTSGLDFTSARISRLALHVVPVSENIIGEQIEVQLNAHRLPELRVHVLNDIVSYRLDLMRFEFLVRVAEGALPNSFSKECYEDVINFKGLLLAKVQKAMAKKEIRNFRYLASDRSGRPSEETINL